MSKKPDVEELNLSDAELIELIKSHGIDRRSVMKVLGVGTALSIGTGSAVAKHDQPHPPHIDPDYGYATPDASDIPEKLEPDHEVELHRELFDPANPETPSIFHFEPTGLSVNPDDIVQFTFKSPNHTITAYHPEHGYQRRIPEDAASFSSPIVNEDGAWLYRFEHEGLYDLYCGVHAVLGMVIRIVVGDLDEEDVPDYEDTFEAEPPLVPPVSAEFLETELNATSDQNENCEWPWLTAPQVLDTDVLDPMHIQDEGKVSFEAIADELGIAFEPDEDH